MNLSFHFKIHADAGFATNDETGENAALFTKITFAEVKSPPEKMDEYHNKLISSVSKQLDCDKRYITAISEEEYNREMEE